MLWTTDIMQKIHKSVPGSPYVEFAVGDLDNVILITLSWEISSKNSFRQREMITRHELKSLRNMNGFVDDLIKRFTEVYINIEGTK